MTSPTVDQLGQGHDVVIDPDVDMEGSRLRIRGDGCTVRIGPGVSGRWDISVSQGASLHIGAGATCWSALVVATDDLHIGADCMFAAGVEIRTTDTHAIYDIDSRRRVNGDRPVHLGDHVWLGKHVTVMKGARIGAGSVVGARSVVSGAVPRFCVAVGAPARAVRHGVVWTRHVRDEVLDEDREAMAVVRRWWTGPPVTPGPWDAWTARVRRLGRGPARWTHGTARALHDGTAQAARLLMRRDLPGRGRRT